MSPYSWTESVPLLVGSLFVIVFLRAQGTYWLARAIPAAAERRAASGKSRGKFTRWFLGPTPRKGASILEKWGVIVIPLCFLTVGVQTAVLAGAGLVRMNWRKFTLAMLPGAAAWALLYGIGLLAVWTAAVTAVAGNPWSYVVIVVVVALFYGIKKLKQTQSKRILRGPKRSEPTVI